VTGSRNIELARLKKKEEERKKNIWPVLQVIGLVLLQCFLAPLGVLLVMKTLEDEWNVVIKAYKLAVFEIWGDFFVLPYIACPCYPYIRVYRLYDIYLLLFVLPCIFFRFFNLIRGMQVHGIHT